MSGMTILALIGLFMWCGALSRRLVHTGTLGCMPRDAQTTEEAESQMSDLTTAYQRLETDMATRVTELEERLDFAERLIAQQKQQAYLRGSA